MEKIIPGQSNDDLMPMVSNRQIFKKEQLWILVVLLGAFIRVLDGIRVPLFMDEMPILYNVAHFLSNKTILPTHFNYPTFFSYLSVIPTAFLFLVLYTISGFPLSGLLDSRWTGFLFSAQQSQLVFGGRFVSLLFAALTIYFIYRWNQNRAGWLAGLIGALVIAVDPAGGWHVVMSRYALPDVTAAFWVLIAMMLCFRYVDEERPGILYRAAFVLGLAIGTKYNTGMGILPLAGALFIGTRSRQWKVALVTGFFLVLGFLTASPGWMIIPGDFVNGYLFEARHMARGHLGTHGTDWIWVIETLWKCHTVILPVLILTFIYSILKRRKRDVLFLLLIIPSFLYIGQFEKKSIHYFLFLYPVTALYIGEMIWDVNRRLKTKSAVTIFAVILAVAFVLQPLYRIKGMIKKDMIPDNRYTAEKWMREHILSGSSVVMDPLTLTGLTDAQAARSRIELMKSSGSEFWKEAQRYYSQRPLYHLLNIREIWNDVDTLAALKTDYLVVSSGNYKRFFTDDLDKIPDQDSPLFDEFMQKKLFYESLFRESGHSYRLVQSFERAAGPHIRIYGRTLSKNEYGENNAQQEGYPGKIKRML